MREALRGQGPRLLAEGAVIVVSVLLALSADAWWSSVEDRARVDDHVRALIRDFDQMAGRNRASLGVAREGYRAGLAIMTALSAEDYDLLSDSAGHWLATLAWYEAFSPSTGAFDALIASGDLELIRDSELKTALGEFYGSFEDVRVSEEGLRGAQLEFFTSDASAEVAGMHRLMGYPEAFPSDIRSPGRDRLRLWATSDAFLNGLLWVALNHQSAAEDYEFLRGEIDRIRPALAHYLGAADS